MAEPSCPALTVIKSTHRLPNRLHATGDNKLAYTLAIFHPVWLASVVN